MLGECLFIVTAAWRANFVPVISYVACLGPGACLKRNLLLAEC